MTQLTIEGVELRLRLTSAGFDSAAFIIEAVKSGQVLQTWRHTIMTGDTFTLAPLSVQAAVTLT